MAGAWWASCQRRTNCCGADALTAAGEDCAGDDDDDVDVGFPGSVPSW